MTRSSVRSAGTSPTIFVVPEPWHRRFWIKVSCRQDCWLWLRCKDRNGYSLFWLDGGPRLGHRVMWEHILKRTVPPGLEIRHRCHVRHCVNPKHLRLGTHKDNMLDAKYAERLPTGDRNHKHRNRVLTDAQERSMMAERQAGSSVKELAVRYGVSEWTASMISRGIRYLGNGLSRKMITHV